MKLLNGEIFNIQNLKSGQTKKVVLMQVDNK